MSKKSTIWAASASNMKPRDSALTLNPLVFGELRHVVREGARHPEEKTRELVR